MFKTRIGILSIVLAFSFLLVLGRMWQLQVTRYEKYHALATRDRSAEQMVPALRAQIVDRFGETLAEDRAVHDISVRVDGLKLSFVQVPEILALHAKYLRDALPDTPQPTANSQQPAANTTDYELEFKLLTARLPEEPFVRDMALTLHRDEDEVVAGVLRALNAVGKGWASPHAALQIVNDVDEKVWLGLRALHEDAFRQQLFSGQSQKPASGIELGDGSAGGSAAINVSVSAGTLPFFPGLVCTVSVRRVYPHGSLGCFVVGAVGELSTNDEEELRHDGILFDNAMAREQYWDHLRENMDDETAARLENILHADVRDPELSSLGELYNALTHLTATERQTVAAMGLSEPVRWMSRPPRMRLSEAELLWLGVGMPASTTKNRLPNRIVGELGVERLYNETVRGKSGMKLRSFQYSDTDAEDDLNYRSNSMPQEGAPIALTLSMRWQSAVEKALKAQENLGAAVVLDVKTGEVLAMASFPDFDPNLFSPPRSGVERQEKLRALLSDPNKPMLNRAISEQYPLGSVMKSLIAAVALEKGLVTTDETFNCPGYIIEGGQKFHCDDSRAHGTVNLLKAIRCSCNVTFHQIGARIGVENLGPFAKLLMGQRTGIDLPGEVPGIYPDRAWRMKAYPNNPSARVWTRGSDFQLAIGQGQMTTTVLQAASLMATISNGGYVVTPHVWLDAPAATPRYLGVSPANLDIVREGLDEVVNVGRAGERGTAYAPFHEHGPELAVRVAGKTSTAEHRKGAKPHAWFAGYAPADHPQIAFAVLLEEAGHGGAVAAPVAYQFLKEIYGTRNSPVKDPGGPEKVADAVP